MKNGIEILVGHAVLDLLINTIFVFDCTFEKAKITKQNQLKI